MTQEEKNKLIELRNYFMERTEYFSERARIITASSQGSHMDKGVANGYIGARSKLEELFDYLKLWECEHEAKSDVNESGSRIEVGCKIRSKTNPDVILRIISDDCHGDEFECSNGSVLSLKQIKKHYDLYIEENKGTIVIS